MENQQTVQQPVQQTVAPLAQPIVMPLLRASVVLGQAWQIYKKRIGVFLGIMGLSILAMVGFGVLIGGIGALVFYFIYLKFTITGIALLIFLAILLILIICISQSWLFTALLYAIKDKEDKIGIIESYKRGWNKILSYLWISFLAGFIILGGCYLFCIPGIMFSVLFSLAAFVLIEENLKGMNALLKSWEYVKGRWWSVFWRFFFIGIVCMLIIFGVFCLFGIFGLILNFLKVPFILGIIDVALNLFMVVFEFLAIPLIMVYLFLVYKNLKDVKGEFVFTPTKGKKAIFISIGVFGILVIFAIAIFATLNFKSIMKPYILKSQQINTGQDQLNNMGQIRTQLDVFYIKNLRYPSSLNELSLDPSQASILINLLTNQPYDYRLQAEGEDYLLCDKDPAITYSPEDQQPVCVASETDFDNLGDEDLDYSVPKE
ncbi:hypothetical protein CVV26_01160 [Candidatus Kuenenbacteria bacterium HGW-Kuenenbacteria-1]|uniref:Glycerophosphoryl diester phosphodiesterase membrane domain-containing protein n=1 Tax=Candidatus Kuenenbacteria bacterium HGW-Kuenenbacteria-1 TaxID=2013812 RepID=A0A2N1UP01_9BACT|nr:MAG: hypothetical protein CVV26_01160 [Candidatus Kuenenbacteria bacterium HGW-Kuenenbacteria-1]